MAKRKRPSPFDMAVRAFKREFGYDYRKSKQDVTKWLVGWICGYAHGVRAGRRQSQLSRDGIKPP